MDDPEPPSSPRSESAGVIECDQFCPCGYNLHRARVELDERLELPVVRCTECGRWNHAGNGSTATRAWLRRLAGLLLFAWAVVLLGFAVAIGFALFGLDIGYFEEHTIRAQAHPTNDRPVVRLYTLEAEVNAVPTPEEKWAMLDAAGFTDPRWQLFNEASELWAYVDDEGGVVGFDDDIDGMRYWGRYQIDRSRLPEVAGRTPLAWGWTLAFALPVLIGTLIVGIFQSTITWHLRWPWVMIPPVILVGLSALGFYLVTLGDQDYFQYARQTAMLSMVFIQGSALLGWIIGLAIGRPIARQVVRLIVPPKPRQMLAFLWHADGKSMPA